MTLTLTHITKAFGETLAVDDVSLEVGQGEIVGLVGENGAGKTTLMRIIAGELSAAQGTVSIEGVIGFVHQHFMLVSEFTIAENLALVSGTERRAEEIIAESGIRLERVGRRAGELAVGEKAKLELIKAISRRPRILILDEPTSVLTPAESSELFDVARRLAADGASILLISHKIAEVLAVATRTIVMRRGRIVADGTGLSAQELAKAMVELEPMEHRLQPVTAPVKAGAPSLHVQNLTVSAGEIVAIIGVAGNGQTELATTLRDTLPRRTTAHIPEDRTRDGVIAEMSIAENIALAAGLRQARARAERLIESFSIRARGPQQRARALSGGNQQKLLLARELDRHPEIIVAAEPTRGLDMEATRFVHAQLRAAVTAGAAVLLITSDLDEALALADAIHVIYRGRLSDRLAPTEAAERAGSLMAGLA